MMNIVKVAAVNTAMVSLIPGHQWMLRTVTFVIPEAILQNVEIDDVEGLHTNPGVFHFT